MNYLIAEIKKRGRRDKVFKVLSSIEEIYTLPTDLDNPKPYNSDYKLEDDEWFHIPNFKETEYCIDLLKDEFISTDFNQIGRANLDKLKFLVAYQTYNENSYFFFQKINLSQLVKKSWFKLSDTPTIEETPIVIINNVADAIYSVNNDILYFKRLTAISSIFRGISELYREATQEETETFLNEEFIELQDDYEASKVKTANRKRIAMAVETFNSFTPEQKAQIFDYIKDYCPDIPYDEQNKRFGIKDEEGLKHLLWGIEQRYYTTKVGGEKRIANSVSKINNNTNA